MTTASDSSSGPFGPVFQIIPGVQSYDWGKTVEQKSLVAQFAEATEELQFKKQNDKPYAELWMGTHPTLPSSIVPPNGTNETQSNEYPTLNSYLGKYPDLIGKDVQKRFKEGGELPFLFKILSIGKALSIQAHPDKELAKRLHAEKPDMYKDDNHKPEMAIALTAFKGFCGFRPVKQIAQFVQTVPELEQVINPNEELKSSLKHISSANSDSINAEVKKKFLKDVFSPLMNADSSVVKKNVSGLAKRYSEAISSSSSSLEVDQDLAKLVITLNEQFPEDVGVLCSFILNVVHLEPGQAAFLKANEPHAYIDGEIVECMAASDNVVRAGLTPKARDVKVLVEMLTYEDSPSDEKRMQPTPFKPDGKSASSSKYDGKSTDVPSILYDPPIDEFSVVRTLLKDGEGEIHRSIDGPSILIISSGQGQLTSHPSTSLQPRTFEIQQPGQIFFIGAKTPVTLQSSTAGEPLITYRAFVEAGN